MGRLALLAGAGDLPERLASCVPDALCIGFAGVDHKLGTRAQIHRFEKMGALFETLKAQGVKDVVMAGAMSRPPLDPDAFDAVMTALAPRLMTAMQGGDDALLRTVVAIFEEQGFAVRGAHEIDPALTAEPGVLAGAPLTGAQQGDALRAADILRALGPLDVGQGAVAEGGVCLGIETLQGTDALFGFVAATPKHLRRGAGVFVKAPKAGQDLRVDMPAIGPQTVRAAHDAGLSAIVIAAGAVLMVHRDETCALADTLGLSLIAQEL